MLNKGYQISETHHGDLSLSIHERINELHRRAEGLAYRVADSAADSGCTDQTAASYAQLGPRQQKAWDMIAEALAWNALSDNTPEARRELALAEQCERDGVAYTVVGIWGDEGHVYQVRTEAQAAIQASAARHGHATRCTAHGGDLAACDPADCDEAALAASFSVTVFDSEATPVPVPAFVADPANPTDAELAAAIQRGLATGQLVDATDWLAAQRAQDAAAKAEHDEAGPEHAAWCAGPGTHLVAIQMAQVFDQADAKAAQATQKLRCRACGYLSTAPAGQDAADRLCCVCFQDGRYCFLEPVPDAEAATATPGIAYVDHDNLCQNYRSQGALVCTCSHVCRCRACQAKRDAEVSA